MKIAVSNQNASIIEEENLVASSEKIYSIDFEFDNSWADFAKTVVFVVGKVNEAIPLVENHCEIPASCLSRPGMRIRIGVYGICDGQRKPTCWCETKLILPGPDRGNLPAPPSPDVYEMLLEEIRKVQQSNGNVWSDQIDRIEVMDRGAYEALPDKQEKTAYFLYG